MLDEIVSRVDISPGGLNQATAHSYTSRCSMLKSPLDPPFVKGGKRAAQGDFCGGAVPMSWVSIYTPNGH